MEDFFLTEFSLDDMEFDFSYEENTSTNQKINQEPQDSHFRFRETARRGFVCESPTKHTTSESSQYTCSIIDKPSPASSSPKLISFEFSNASSLKNIEMEEHGSSLRFGRRTKRKACVSARPPVLAREHLLAERKRREKISENFIALSALLPDLKKADKATILGDTIKHLKELQERIRKLEEEKVATKDMESVIFVKKSRIFMEEETHSSCLSSDENLNQALPEIEAKISKKDVLIRIHCEKSKGCMVRILKEIEKLHLSVMNSIVLPFGNSTLDITVLAKMEEDFSTTVKDIVKNLRLAIPKSL